MDLATIELDERVGRGTLFRPTATHSPLPAVVVMHGSSGDPAPIKAVSAELARTGLAALALRYFGAPGLPETLNRIPLEYFGSAVEWLSAQPDIDTTRMTNVGISRGSEAAYLTAILYPSLVTAAVGLVPGNVVLCGWPPDGPAWLHHGEALPYVTRFGPTAADDRALIPVEQIRGPLMAIGAEADEVWPSAAMARAIAARRDAHGVGHDDVVRSFPAASHALGRAVPLPPRPRTDAPLDPDHRARAILWPVLVKFVHHSASQPPEP